MNTYIFKNRFELSSLHSLFLIFGLDTLKLGNNLYLVFWRWYAQLIWWGVFFGIFFFFLYMQKPEYVLANETHKILWDFGIQTDHQIPIRTNEN